MPEGTGRRRSIGCLASAFAVLTSLLPRAAMAEGPAAATTGAEAVDGGAARTRTAPPGDANATKVVTPGDANATPDNAHAGNSTGGYLDFNVYPYLTSVDKDSVFTLNAFAKLPLGLSYFGFVNVINQSGRKPFVDTAGYYTEQNLRFAPFAIVPLDLTIQYNMLSGEDNDRLRFGVRWRLDDTPLLEPLFDAIHLDYSIDFHVFTLDHDSSYVWQMEHVFRLSTPYLDHRLYVSGFADHTFNGAVPPGAPASPVVLEVQGGVRLLGQFYAVAEYRINQYRVGAETNAAFGAEYTVKW